MRHVRTSDPRLSMHGLLTSSETQGKKVGARGEFSSLPLFFSVSEDGFTDRSPNELQTIGAVRSYFKFIVAEVTCVLNVSYHIFTCKIEFQNMKKRMANAKTQGQTKLLLFGDKTIKFIKSS